MGRWIASLRARRTVSPRAHEIVAWAALGLLVLIVVTGAGVRLTGSGLGCHEWPHCSEGSVTPQDGHAYIEFGNRMVTTPVAIACGLALLFALLREPYRRDFTHLGLWLFLSVVAQAVLGGITVLTGLHPVIVMAHFLLSMVTIFVAALLIWRVRREKGGRPESPERDPRTVHLVRGLFGFGSCVVLLGTIVTAAGPHAGGEGTGDAVKRLDFLGDETFSTAITVHARIAAAFGIACVAVWVLARRRGAERDLLLPLGVVCGLVAAAGAVGTLQYHVLDYPASVVWVHVAITATLFAALSWAVVAAGRPRAAIPEPMPGDEPVRELAHAT